MRILLDTCVISELRKTDIHPRLKELVDMIDEENIFISVISIGELIKGVSLLDDGQRKRELLSWVGGLERNFADRILGIDQETAHIWGEVSAKANKSGKIVPACDGLIAATALRHGLHLVTRNTADFTPTAVMLIDPWTSK